MGGREREPNRVKAVELEMRGRAIEDSIRDAAEALSVQVDNSPIRPLSRPAGGHYPFEAALKAELRAMESRFGALVHNAPYAMLATDGHGRIAFFNLLARRLFGHDGDELAGAKLSSIVTGPLVDDLEARGSETVLAEIGDGAARGVELVGHRRDGGEFPAEVLFSVVAGSDGPIVCLSVRDLGSERAERRRLSETERRLRLVFDRLPDAVVAVNARGRITQINATAETMFGFNRDEIVGKPASRMLPEAVVEQLAAALAAPFDAPRETFRVLAARKDGSNLLIELRLGRIDEDRAKTALALIRDVTEMNDPAARSKETAGFYRLVAEAVPEAVLVVRASDEIAFANARAEALFGYGTNEMTGEKVTHVLPEGFAERPGASIPPGGVSTPAQEGTVRAELFGRRNGGGRFPAEIMVGSVDAMGERMRIATVRDLSLQRAAEQRERAPARKARPRASIDPDIADGKVPLAGMTLDSIGDALVSMDLAGNVYFLNQAAEELTGWLWRDAAGRPVYEVVHVIDAGTHVTFQEGSNEPAQGNRAIQFNPNVALIRRDGREVPIEGSIAPIEGRDGRPAGKVMIFRDVSLARARDQKITHSAQHDALTGLPNRVLLNDRISGAISIAPRHHKRVAVLFLDLDGFKQINDTLGHATGDKLLQAVAERLMGCVRGSDTVSRIGGDEFVVLLSEVERAEDSAITARRMLEAVSEPYVIDQHDLKISVSIGVSAYPDDGTDAESLIKNADAAMYQAKENGRHGYQFYKPAMNLRAVERQDVEDALRRALEREEFALHFQPKVNLRTGEIAGAEALLRWEHPTKGPVSPALFVPVAESSGLIAPIGRWVMHEACRQVHAWQASGLAVPSVAVNVSAFEFAAPRFLEGVFDVLNETGLEPGALELELNEGALMKRADATQSILEALAAAGVQMSVDDFGTGYSNLDHLRRLPIHMLKIDQSFVREITVQKGEVNLVAAVLSMAQSLNLKVIAEGVETAEELAFLQRHHCDQAQGYYFSRPLPASEFGNLLRDGLMLTMASRRYPRPFGRLQNREHSAP